MHGVYCRRLTVPSLLCVSCPCTCSDESLHKSVKLRDRLIDAIAKGTVPPETPLDSANTDSPPLLYGPSESLAYVLHGLLPAYGSVTRILREVQKSMPPGE